MVADWIFTDHCALFGFQTTAGTYGSISEERESSPRIPILGGTDDDNAEVVTVEEIELTRSQQRQINGTT